MRRDIINPHTVKGDVSRRGCRETANNPQRCGLATAAGAQKCEEFRIVDIQIDVIENQLVVKRHAEVPQANQLFGHLSSPVRKIFFSYLFSLFKGRPLRTGPISLVEIWQIQYIKNEDKCQSLFLRISKRAGKSKNPLSRSVPGQGKTRHVTWCRRCGRRHRPGRERCSRARSGDRPPHPHRCPHRDEPSAGAQCLQGQLPAP